MYNLRYIKNTFNYFKKSFVTEVSNIDNLQFFGFFYKTYNIYLFLTVLKVSLKEIRWQLSINK